MGPIEIKGEAKGPYRLGTVETVDMNSGEVISRQRNAMTLLPCPPGVCQECAVDHPHDQPHNQQSLHYQYRFYSEHGRWPTWTDAMAHCTPEVQALTRQALLLVLKKHGLEIPADLMNPKPAGR